MHGQFHLTQGELHPCLECNRDLIYRKVLAPVITRENWACSSRIKPWVHAIGTYHKKQVTSFSPSKGGEKGQTPVNCPRNVLSCVCHSSSSSDHVIETQLIMDVSAINASFCGVEGTGLNLPRGHCFILGGSMAPLTKSMSWLTHFDFQKQTLMQRSRFCCPLRPLLSFSLSKVAALLMLMFWWLC